MNRRDLAASLGALIVVLGSDAASAAKPPETWDGLTRVKSKNANLLYLQPGADFRVYRRVMLDPTQVAFHKDWKRDYNGTARFASKIDDKDMQKAVQQGGVVATELFTKAFTKGGYEVVTAPAPDVLRISTAVVNLRVNAPDVDTVGRSYTFAPEAGEATLILEARDSTTNALIGRVVDRKLAGDNMAYQRNRVTNRADFRHLATGWAQKSVKGLNTLKGTTP